MKILVVGSKGFIGSNVYDYLKSNNDYVYACDVVNDYVDENYYQIDATNANYHSIFEKNEIKICINCSGAASVPLSIENPLRDYTLNTLNVYRLLDAIRAFQPLCKFINLSSAAVYGNPIALPIKESFAYNPVSPYGFHKMQAEMICKQFNYLHGIKTCSLRIFSAYGEGLKKQLFWDLFQKFQKNEKVELFGTGNETRDFIYISDIIQVISCVINQCNFDGNVINVANGEELSIDLIATIFKQELNSEKEIVFNNEIKEGDPLNWKADISLLSEIGYSKNVSIKEGIKNYILWAKNNL